MEVAVIERVWWWVTEVEVTERAIASAFWVIECGSEFSFGDPKMQIDVDGDRVRKKKKIENAMNENERTKTN